AALDALNRAGLRVPALLELDFRHLVVYETFIPGVVVREGLAKRGAKVRDRDVVQDVELAKLPRQQLRRRRIEEGRKRLCRVMSAEQVRGLVQQVRSIHELGFLCLDVKYGNV